jgi:hypothetical protein
MQKPGSALEILAQIVASMSVPDVWRFRAGLPVVLALFSAIFWLLRQLKWRNRHQVAPYLLVSTKRTVGYVGEPWVVPAPLSPSSVIPCW